MYLHAECLPLCLQSMCIPVWVLFLSGYFLEQTLQTCIDLMYQLVCGTKTFPSVSVFSFPTQRYSNKSSFVKIKLQTSGRKTSTRALCSTAEIQLVHYFSCRIFSYFFIWGVGLDRQDGLLNLVLYVTQHGTLLGM